MTADPGQRYRILETWQGSLACTQLAEDTFTGRLVILKRVSLQNTLACRQAAREADLLLKLDGCGAPCLYDCLQTGTEKVLVQEYLPEALDRPRSRSRRKQYLKWLAEHLHRIHCHGYLYLDLKPEHLRLRDGKPVLIDYDGILETDSRECYFGTPGRMAPELYSHDPKGPEADAWAWGLLAKDWHCFPWRQVSCLKRDPEKRSDPVSALDFPGTGVLAICIAVSVFAAGSCLPAAAVQERKERDLVLETLLDPLQPLDLILDILDHTETVIPVTVFTRICDQVSEEDQALILAGYVLRMEQAGRQYILPEEWNDRFGPVYDSLTEIRRNQNDRQDPDAGSGA